MTDDDITLPKHKHWKERNKQGCGVLFRVLRKAERIEQMVRDMRSRLKPLKNQVGYNSHGVWSTLGEIRCEEIERGNCFPKLNYPLGTPAMWICLTRRKALRYAALAERWDHLDDETQPLTCEEEQMLESVVEIPLKSTDIIVHDDRDGGYLVLRVTKGKH